jgi:hypothetical protein
MPKTLPKTARRRHPQWSWELVRLAIPHRVYTQIAHALRYNVVIPRSRYHIMAYVGCIAGAIPIENDRQGLVERTACCTPQA